MNGVINTFLIFGFQCCTQKEMMLDMFMYFTCLHIFWGWRSHTSSGLSTVTSWVVLRHWGCPDTKAQLSGAQAWR